MLVFGKFVKLTVLFRVEKHASTQNNLNYLQRVVHVFDIISSLFFVSSVCDCSYLQLNHLYLVVSFTFYSYAFISFDSWVMAFILCLMLVPQYVLLVDVFKVNCYWCTYRIPCYQQ